MKIFHCDHCGQLVFFENVRCLSCGHALAYAPDVEDVVSLDPSDDGLWRSRGTRRRGTHVPSLRQLRPRERLQLGDARRRSRAALRLVSPDAHDPRPRPGRPQGSMVPPRGREAALGLQSLAARASRRQQDRRRGARRRVRLPRRDRRAGAHRSRRRRHHDQRRRSGRRGARAAPPAAARALPDVARTLPSRDRPLLLAAPARGQRSPRGVPRAVRRRARRLCGGAAEALRRWSGRMAGSVRQRLREHAPLGGLGGDLGALPAHDRHARDGGGLLGSRFVRVAPTSRLSRPAARSDRAVPSTRRSRPGSR